ncbi:hypothetical protein [Phenylobacterium sp.]|uniref:hypothetical protein n=1 Tax=Phenylobacterium sp. TaxID=1871053 RepID=UPI0025E098F0|nr:hypothetical protein [Phenylobacterium sp.]MBX3482508.1 hypothetical protein [Phenylobacterium sp.]
MAAVAAQASIRARALDVIVRHTGPIGIGEKLTEARDAMLCAVVVCDLEATFGVDLDDFWRAASVEELAAQVEAQADFRAMATAAAVSNRAVDLALERARRARAPLFPAATARDARMRRRPGLAREARPFTDIRAAALNAATFWGVVALSALAAGLIDAWGL